VVVQPRPYVGRQANEEIRSVFVVSEDVHEAFVARHRSRSMANHMPCRATRNRLNFRRRDPGTLQMMRRNGAGDLLILPAFAASRLRRGILRGLRLRAWFTEPDCPPAVGLFVRLGVVRPSRITRLGLVHRGELSVWA
jgi:hypothetical protein